MRGLGWMTLSVLVGCASPAKPPARVEGTAVRQTPVSPSESSPSESSPSESSSGASAPSAPTPDPAPVAAEPSPSAAETRNCAARGGTIQPVCMLGELACVVRYRDGGKRCSDKRDCAGECLYEGPDPPPPKATGSCQLTNDPCGCKAPIHHGHVDPALCVD